MQGDASVALELTHLASSIKFFFCDVLIIIIIILRKYEKKP
jgi:hypothetical protein